MTPMGIKTGREFSSYLSAQTVGAGATEQLVAGSGDRVGLVVSLPAALAAAIDGTVAIGFAVSGTFAPLTCLTSGHPVCYLSVDKIGSVLYGAISAVNGTGGALVLGVTDVRYPKEVP